MFIFSCNTELRDSETKRSNLIEKVKALEVWKEKFHGLDRQVKADKENVWFIFPSG
jgi:hypothetical protein